MLNFSFIPETSNVCALEGQSIVLTQALIGKIQEDKTSLSLLLF